MREVAPDLRGATPALLPLRVRDLTLEIAGKPRVDRVDLDLGGEGITVVMGPNGAGKSLLLRLLHGLIPPTSGEILWGGHPLTTEVRRRQALVFQKPVLLRRSVAANLDFVLRGRDVPARREALLDHVGLGDHCDQPARLLSGGEQQRLALARALATDPQVLFLDEPTASLDPASVLKIEEIVRGAAARGTRIVFISHDLGQARRLADDVVFLANGRLAEHGPAETFFDNPASEAARDYIAVPRQPESGPQTLFEKELARSGVETADLTLAPLAHTESDAVLAVAGGAADVAFGLEALARPCGLHFVPIVEERFDLIVDRRAWFEPPMQRLLSFCATPPFRDHAITLAGCDVAELGQVRWNA